MHRGRILGCGLVLGAIACGGKKDVTTGPVTNPPVASSIAIMVGDGQTAAPATLVSIKPVVIVRDATGKPFQGASVSFTIDAGGGSIDAPSATTGPDGTASPGDWRLGPNEGENRLKASVGSLTPVVLTSHAVITRTAVDATIAAAGGTLTYHKAGDPLDGLSLTVPAGAYTTPGQWTVQIVPSPAPPAGARAGPTLDISTDQDFAQLPVQIRIPVHTGPDSLAIAFLVDSTTGNEELLGPVSFDSSAIVVATSTLTPSTSGNLASSSSRRSASSTRVSRTLHRGQVAAAQPTVHLGRVKVVLIRANQSALSEAASGFVPGVDDWEFPNYGSYITPNGQSGGHVLSELFYFSNLKQQLGALTRHYETFTAWPGNPLGYRVAALSELDAPWTNIQQVMQSLGALQQGNYITFDEAQMDMMGFVFGLKHTPLVMVATEPGQPPIALLAYSVFRRDSVHYADPTQPGVEGTLRVANHTFFPTLLTPIVGGPSVLYHNFRIVMASSVLNTLAVSTHFADLTAGHVAQNQFPGFTLEYYDEDAGAWAPLNVNPLDVDWQQITLRAHCVSCARHLQVTGQPNDLAALDVWLPNNTMLASDRTAGQVSFKPPSNTTIGIQIMGGVDGGAAGTLFRHVDFTTLLVRTSTYFITPDPGSVATAAPLTLSINNQTPATTPAQVWYTWNFNDGNVSVVTDGTTSVQHSWTLPGIYNVTVTVRDVANNRNVGKATAQVSVGVPVPIWRLTSFHNIQLTIPQNPVDTYTLPIYSDDFNIWATLQSVPADGLILYQPQPTTLGGTNYNQAVYLQFDPTRHQAGLDPSLESRRLGEPATQPPRVGDVNEVLAGLNDPTYASGSIVGDASNFTTPAPNAHTVTEWKINATLNGVTLSGTITRLEYLWEADLTQPFPHPLVNKGTLTFVWQFTATRIQ